MPTSSPVLIAGDWRDADATAAFQAENPATREPLPERFPVSSWADCEAALDAAVAAFEELQTLPGERIAAFLESYAATIEREADSLVELAHLETALPVSPRLAEAELPRTTGQLRQAAAAARSGSWRQPVIDTANGIRACYEPIGPVCVFGPNNFPFAFGSVSGGDFAAALAAGNPVIGKANSSHPATTRRFAECAREALEGSGLPPATVQLIYRTSHDIGQQLVTDPRVGATGYTGSRSAGLALKQAADGAGKPIYLELSSVNPVVVLPGALAERGDELAAEFSGSCLMGAGQFCTNPGLVVLIAGEAAERFVESVAARFREAPVGTLLSAGVEKSLRRSHRILVEAGAELVCGGGDESPGAGYSVPNTLLRASAARFLRDPETFQTEAFGNTSLFVVATDLGEARALLEALEGNLTGALYTAQDGSDDEAHDLLAPLLRRKVGRLLNDKMPTGVAVSPAMNHGGPYPATGHPGFTAVGIPASMLRFARLASYDNVRPGRLPEILRDDYAGPAQRLVDGAWV